MRVATLVADGSFAYKPRYGFSGTDSFAYATPHGTAAAAAIDVLGSEGSGSGELRARPPAAARPPARDQVLAGVANLSDYAPSVVEIDPDYQAAIPAVNDALMRVIATANT